MFEGGRGRSSCPLLKQIYRISLTASESGGKAKCKRMQIIVLKPKPTQAHPNTETDELKLVSFSSLPYFMTSYRAQELALSAAYLAKRFLRFIRSSFVYVWKLMCYRCFFFNPGNKALRSVSNAFNLDLHKLFILWSLEFLFVYLFILYVWNYYIKFPIIR